MDTIRLGIWKNLKQGNKYLVTGTRTNSTNAQNGQIMVEYQNALGDKYTREIREFHTKFECTLDVHT